MGRGGTRRRMEGTSYRAFCKIRQIKSAEWGHIMIFEVLLRNGIC